MILAEIGDKTNLIALSLMSKSKKPYLVAFGGSVGITITSLIGVVIGYLLGNAIHLKIVPIISGIIFLILGFSEIKNKKEEDTHLSKISIDGLTPRPKVFGVSIFLVCIAEFGDKSQIFLITSSATNNPITVFFGAIFGMVIVMVISAFFGDQILLKLDENKLRKIAAILFIIAGIWLVVSGVLLFI